MKDIRIGNDILVTWELSRNGEIFSLEDKAVSVYLKSAFERTKLKDFVVSGNIVIWTFFGKDQKRKGVYSLELVINEDSKGMITTDACDFVNLVACSCNVDGSDDNNVTTETISLESNINAIEGTSITVDTYLSETSENPVQNKVITAELKKKADKSDVPTKLSQLEQDIEVGGGGLKYAVERTFYDSEFGLTDEQRAYNIETYNLVKDGKIVLLFVDGLLLDFSSLDGNRAIFSGQFFVSGYQIFCQLTIDENGDTHTEEPVIKHISDNGTAIVYANETSERNREAYYAIVKAQGKITVLANSGIANSVVTYPASLVLASLNGTDYHLLYFSSWKSTSETSDGKKVSFTAMQLYPDGKAETSKGTEYIIDAQMSDTSTNVVYNKTIKKYVDDAISNIEVGGYDDT